MLASKRSKEKEKEREREKEREKERDKERLKDNPPYFHLNGKESRKFKNEMQQPDALPLASSFADDFGMDAAASMKDSDEIEFAVDSAVIGDGKFSVVYIR